MTFTLKCYEVEQVYYSSSKHHHFALPITKQLKKVCSSCYDDLHASNLCILMTVDSMLTT